MTKEKIEKGQNLMSKIDEHKHQIKICSVDENSEYYQVFSIHINNETSGSRDSCWLCDSSLNEVVEFVRKRSEERLIELEKEFVAL